MHISESSALTNLGLSFIFPFCSDFRSCFPPELVFVAEVEGFVRHWSDMAIDLCEVVTEAVDNCVGKLIRVQFIQYQGLASHLLSRCKQEIEKQRDVAHARILRLQKDEMDPFTIDNHFMEKVESLRQSVENLDVAKIQTQATTTNELCIALEGYFSVASSRFIDHVCMLLATELLSDTIDSLAPKLVGENLDDEAYMLMFTEADDQMLRRSFLEATIKRLGTASRELASFGMVGSPTNH
jgi:hypothetical protein